MPMPLATVSFLAFGVVLLVIAVHVIRSYRQFIRSDPATTITSDVIFVILFGSWAPPALLAAIVFYVGSLSILFGLFVGWLWLLH